MIVGPSIDELAAMARDVFCCDAFGMEVSRQENRINQILDGRLDCYTEALKQTFAWRGAGMGVILALLSPPHRSGTADTRPEG